MKAGCHLCEEVERELASLRSRYPHTLERVDISSEATLMQRYGEQIPVLLIQGREYVAPLSRTVIEHALKDERVPNPGVRAESSDAPAQAPKAKTQARSFGEVLRMLPWNHSRGR